MTSALTFWNELWMRTTMVYIKLLSEPLHFYIFIKADPGVQQHLWKSALKQLLSFCYIVAKSSILEGEKLLDIFFLDNCLNLSESWNLHMGYHLTSSDILLCPSWYGERKLCKTQHRRQLFLLVKLQSFSVVFVVCFDSQKLFTWYFTRAITEAMCTYIYCTSVKDYLLKDYLLGNVEMTDLISPQVISITTRTRLQTYQAD